MGGAGDSMDSAALTKLREAGFTSIQVDHMREVVRFSFYHNHRWYAYIWSKNGPAGMGKSGFAFFKDLGDGWYYDCR